METEQPHRKGVKGARQNACSAKLSALTYVSARLLILRRYLRRRGIRLTIPCRSNERHRGKFDKTTYRQRNRVERMINRLK